MRVPDTLTFEAKQDEQDRAAHPNSSRDSAVWTHGWNVLDLLQSDKLAA